MTHCGPSEGTRFRFHGLNRCGRWMDLLGLGPPHLRLPVPLVVLVPSSSLSPARAPCPLPASSQDCLVSLQGGVPACQARNASYVGRAAGQAPAGGVREQPDAVLSSPGTPRAVS